MTSLFSNCFADKTFKVSLNWLTLSIVVDHDSLNDVILSVILKIRSGVLNAKMGEPLNAISVCDQVFFLFVQLQI